MKQRLSLKGRGLQLLAQREQSQAELKRKLTVHAERMAREPADSATTASAAADAPAGVAEQVDAVLEWLAAGRFSSDERFAESRIHARAARYGNLRIRSELAQHGVAASADLAQQLQATEFDRAHQVWQRKFASPPADAAAQARQARFLAGRGFSPDVIRQVMRLVGRLAPGALVEEQDPG